MLAPSGVQSNRGAVQETNQMSTPDQNRLSAVQSIEEPRVSGVLIGVFWGLVCAHVVLMVSLRLYPFVDLPHHLATATIWRHYGESTNDFATFYRVVALAKPNTLHSFLCSLPLFPTVELANKILFASYVVSVPTLIFLLIRRLHGNPWFSLLSLLLLYNNNVYWGFIGFTLAIPLVLALVYLLLAPPWRVSWLRDVAVGAILILLFFTHLLAMVFCVLLYGLWCFYTYRTSRRLILTKLLPVAPVVGLTATFWLTHQHGTHENTLSFLLSYYREEYIDSLFGRKHLLYLDNQHFLPGHAGKYVGGIFSLTILLAAVSGLRGTGRTVMRALTNKELKVMALFLLAAIACYSLLPNSLPGQWILYTRFSCFVWLFLIVLGGALAGNKWKGFLAVCLSIVCVLHLALSVEYFVQFNRENREFTRELLPDEAQGSVLAGMAYDYEFRGAPVYIHFHNYNTVWTRGVTVSLVGSYRFGTIRRKVSAQVLPEDNEWVGYRRNYRGQYSDVDFILLRGDLPEEAATYFEHFRSLKRGGRWQLYENERSRLKGDHNE